MWNYLFLVVSVGIQGTSSSSVLCLLCLFSYVSSTLSPSLVVFSFLCSYACYVVVLTLWIVVLLLWWIFNLSFQFYSSLQGHPWIANMVVGLVLHHLCLNANPQLGVSLSPLGGHHLAWLSVCLLLLCMLVCQLCSGWSQCLCSYLHFTIFIFSMVLSWQPVCYVYIRTWFVYYIYSVLMDIQ